MITTILIIVLISWVFNLAVGFPLLFNYWPKDYRPKNQIVGFVIGSLLFSLFVSGSILLAYILVFRLMILTGYPADLILETAYQHNLEKKANKNE